MWSTKPQKVLHLHLEEEKKTPKFTGDYMVFEKHDGWYGYLDFPSCAIHSGAEREIPSLRELSDKIRENRPHIKGRLIFEIMIEGLEYNSFPTLNGILNRKDEQVDNVYLQVHDYIPEWNCTSTAEYRYRVAAEVVQRIGLPEVRMSPILGVSNDPDMWRLYAKSIWRKGGEGVVLKQCIGAYWPEKRNYTMLKIKEEITLDLKVVGVAKGKVGSKYEDIIGSLIVQEKNGLTHTVSGMTDEERNAWSAKPESIIGKIVEIKAMKRLVDGSLREPRYKAVRWDKSEGQ